jgi:Amt family ammonium transporter
VNPAAANGWLYGNPYLVLIQAISIAAVALYAAAASYLILKLVAVTIGLRVGPHAEQHGLDPVLHGEHGYRLHVSMTPLNGHEGG